VSEELIRKGLTEDGIKVGKYDYYPIGDTTLNQLCVYKIIPCRDYKEYSLRKPDALLVDRRDKKQPKVVLVMEYKSTSQFRTPKQRINAVEECNDLCQELGAEIGIASDRTYFVWFNPNHPDVQNSYSDRTTGQSRSYTIIKTLESEDFARKFELEGSEDEKKLSLRFFDLVRNSITESDSIVRKIADKNPAPLAKQIWQDVWLASGASPDKCLYTFIELFIFKYLSDLGVLDEDQNGNKVSFKHVMTLKKDKALRYYISNVRPYLKSMFPADSEDKTSIINGSVLNAKVAEHSIVFHKILKRFESFGELREIDPKFKSQVFEDFMKENISKKNLGQFFTPRNIIDAMVEISDIDHLDEGSRICDPACGVGGFILEPIKVKEKGLNFYYTLKNGKIVPKYKFKGYDKGFENEEQLAIILAKANMLIFLSELLKDNPTISKEFADLFNSTFKLVTDTILGTLKRVDEAPYDLILTNPPYVMSGSSNYKDAIKNDGKLREFYKVNGSGVESLFLEWIIRKIKPDRRAIVIIPQGILSRTNGDKLRKFILDECILDGIISLPVNSFYTTPTKTYILAVTKKSAHTEDERKASVQKTPVFTYLVSNIGETLDINRFPIEDNDLIEMSQLFKQFRVSKDYFKSTSDRCKIQNIEKFSPDGFWLVDRWWSQEEKISLGVEEEESVISLSEFKERVGEIQETLKELNEIVSNI